MTTAQRPVVGESDKAFEQRFWAKVDKSDPEGCWLWTAATLTSGVPYGMTSVARRGQLAHRVAYELAKGPIPEGMCVLHSCGTPTCVRPDHLYAGEQHHHGGRKSGCIIGAPQPPAPSTPAHTHTYPCAHPDALECLAQRHDAPLSLVALLGDGSGCDCPCHVAANGVQIPYGAWVPPGQAQPIGMPRAIKLEKIEEQEDDGWLL